MIKEKCPICDEENIIFQQHKSFDPYAGEVKITTIKCNYCDYKKNDVELEKISKPKTYEVEIENENDLNIRIIKSSNSDIEIPELSLYLESSNTSEGFITNVEGLLKRFENQIKFIKKSSNLNNEKKENLNLIIKNIEKVFLGKKKIKIKLIDNFGNSAIISQKAKIKENGEKHQ